MMTDWVFGQENAEKAAVIDGERNVTFAGLRQKIAAVCQSLRQLNKGRIALYLANDDDYLAAFFGVILAEMAVFPLNVLMTGYEIAALLEQGEVSAVITSKAYRALFQDGAGAGRSVLYMEDIHMCGACGPAAAPAFDDDAPMVLLGTSGTTGNVKIVQLSKRNIETSLSGYLEKAAFEANDTGDSRFVISVPFSSAYGIMCLCACMIKGFGVVLLKGAFTPELFCKTIASHRVTHYEGGALILQLMEQLHGRELP